MSVILLYQSLTRRLFDSLLSCSAHFLPLVNEHVNELVNVDILLLPQLQVILLDEVSSRVNLLPLLQGQIRAALDLQKLEEVFLDVVLI